MSPMSAEHSPDESVKGNSAPVQVTRITLPSPRELILATLLAASLLGNFYTFEYARDVKTMAWVNADDLKKLQTHELPDLRSRIETAEKLVEVYGLKESLDVNYHHQPSASDSSAARDRRSAH